MRDRPARQRGVCCELPVRIDEGWAVEISELLKALADPTRLSMVACLWRAAESVCICDFTAAFELSQPTISHHMARLRSAGLVQSHRQGIWVYYRLRDDLSPVARGLVESLLSAGSSLT